MVEDHHHKIDAVDELIMNCVDQKANGMCMFWPSEQYTQRSVKTGYTTLVTNNECCNMPKTCQGRRTAKNMPKKGRNAKIQMNTKKTI